METNELNALLTNIIRGTVGASDFVLVSGKSPQIKCQGRLQSFDGEPILTSSRIEALAKEVLAENPHLREDLAKTGSCDCSYCIEGIGRFRANIYKQNGSYAMVLKRLPSQVPSLEDLNLALAFREITQQKSGLVFVTGGAGSGKTTTVAALLNEINSNAEAHVVTLEDPIEFLHPPKVATFSQRELGRDFFSFTDGLKAALRQAPEVIFIGEIRDRATMEIALTAAETGYLVFSTMHTVNAAQTIHRILGMFEKGEETQIRERLADALSYVVSQRLVEKQWGGRLLVTELMGKSRRTREAIAMGENENRKLSVIIEAGETSGWHSFEQCLLKAYCDHLITEDTAVSAAVNKAQMRQMLDVARKRQEGLGQTESIRMIEEMIPPPPVPAVKKQELTPPEDQPETFMMSCPKCGAAAELGVSYYDFLVECPTCKESVLARPIESAEIAQAVENASELVRMPDTEKVTEEISLKMLTETEQALAASNQSPSLRMYTDRVA
jgi:twitching motility protein PilT